MKRYKLEFEYLLLITKQWEQASREVDESKLPSLQEQKRVQETMADVRNSQILVQEVTPWRKE